MDYKLFSVEDFVLDSDFRRWVLEPTAESNTFWQEWLKQHPHKLSVLQEARALVLKLPRLNYGWNDEMGEALWERIQGETQSVQIDRETAADHLYQDEAFTKVIPLNSGALLGSAEDRSIPVRPRYRIFLRMAASILVILSIGTISYFSFERVDDTAVVRPMALLVQDAPLGTKSRFSLHDGTKVILNAGSRIIYPKEFSDDERLIELEGEAFLEIAKDKSRPFRVKTGTVVTQALGTAFNIRNQQNAIEIALVEGSVSVNSIQRGMKDDALLLVPGERARLHNNGYLTKDIFDVKKVTAWKDDILYLERVSESEFLERIERWYGITVTTKGESLKEWNYSGTFDDKPLDFVLMAVGYSMDFKYTIVNEEVTIIYE